jgi:hypothetical protein
MTQAEFHNWVDFYRAFPFDDLHRFHRPAALIAATGAKDTQAAYESSINFLQPDPRNEGLSDADMNTMRAFGYRVKAN